MSEPRQSIFIFHTPKGMEFKKCSFCHNPVVDYTHTLSWGNCIWCEIHKPEKETYGSDKPPF